MGSVPLVNEDASALLGAGRRLGVRSVLEGKINLTLQEWAQDNADYEARLGRQTGHARFVRYGYSQLSKALPGYKLAENTAESWGREDREEAASEMFNSWRQSSGHWRSVNGPAKLIGYGMAKSRNGKYYSTVVIAN